MVGMYGAIPNLLFSSTTNQIFAGLKSPVLTLPGLATCLGFQDF